jgi:tetratricopeptide (TPR) repeat protein
MAGDFLEEAGERDAIVLADHFEKGQKPARAVRWLRVAANQAMEVDDLKAALDRVDRGVRLGAQGEDLAELRVVESEARYWKGEYVEAERAARAGRKCEDAKLGLRAISALVVALGPQAKFEEIAELDRLLGERPAQPELLVAWLTCRADCASFLAAGGDYEARAHAIALLEREENLLDIYLRGRLESFRAHLARANGKPAEAAAGFQRTSEIFDQAGFHRAATESLGNSGSGLVELGLLEEAEAQMRRLWAIAERMGLNHLMGGTLYALSNILAYQNRLDEARDFGERAVNYTTETNDHYFRSYARLYLSVIEHLAGNYERAEEHARAAMQLIQDDPSMRPFGIALLARALNAQGRAAEALLLAKDAFAQMQALGSLTDGEATVRLALVECLIAANDIQSAKEIVFAAATWLRSRADTISDGGQRGSFIERIPEHRRILELVRELGIENVF